MSSPTFEALYPVIRAIARRESDWAVRSFGLPAADREDLESELVIDFYLRLDRFDPHRASVRTFATHVMRRKLISLLRLQAAKRRGGGVQHCSLNQTVTDPEGNTVEAGDLICADQADAASAAISAGSRHEFWTDISPVLASLPAPLQALTLQLCWATPAQVARDSHEPPSTIYGRVRRLRSAFERSGINRDYFAGVAR